jgi:hypothetical protein
MIKVKPRITKQQALSSRPHLNQHCCIRYKLIATIYDMTLLLQ